MSTVDLSVCETIFSKYRFNPLIQKRKHDVDNNHVSLFQLQVSLDTIPSKVQTYFKHAWFLDPIMLGFGSKHTWLWFAFKTMIIKQRQPRKRAEIM